MVGLSATRWTIVQAAQRGDEAALRAVWDKYRPAVLAWLRQRGLPPETAEDVAQEAFLGLLRRGLAGAQAGAGRFRGLVFAIARNTLLKHQERELAQKRGAGRVQPLGERDVAGAEPDEAFDREWLGAIVRAGLARLEAAQPELFFALRRFVLDGVPQAEIAREVGVSPGALKKRVFRAKRLLATYLREEVWRYACSPAEYEAELAFLAGLLGDPELVEGPADG